MRDVGLACSPPWQEEQVTVVQATEAIRLCREGGHEALSKGQAAWHVDSLVQRDMASVRRFVLQTHLLGVRLAQVEDHTLADLLRAGLKRGDLIAIRACMGGNGEEGATSALRRLVRMIATNAGSTLAYGGRRYRLVADADLSKVPNRNSYETTSHNEAAAVLEGLAKQSGTTRELAGLLDEARANLAADWRPPRLPEGLVLLRRTRIEQALAPSSEPALTPSQLAQLYKPTGVVEIELVDTTGNPVPGEAWEVLLPDGSTRSGTLDEDGMAVVTSIPEGNCQVRFPQLDPDAWSPLGTHPL